MQAGSRTVWAFSRDQMLPLSRVWYKIWHRTNTPVIAVWIYALCCVLINLIGLGSYITIAAVFEICAICLDWSYCLPIIFKLMYNRFEKGPWNLGRWSFILNVWAILWTAVVSVVGCRFSRREEHFSTKSDANEPFLMIRFFYSH